MAKKRNPRRKAHARTSKARRRPRKSPRKMRKPARRNVRPTHRPKRALVRKPQRPSSKRTKLVLVSGATGKQGGALARLLLTKGFTVRAFTRKPESAPGQVLKKLGAELVVGSFDDRASLEQAMKGIDVAFIMGTPFEGGPEVEIRQGIAAVDAAKVARLPHLVYTSVANADKNTGVPHFDSKYEVEQHLGALGIPHTIIAPVFFMENHFSPWSLPALKQGKLMFPLPATRKLQQIALADIAAFAALVIEHPEKFTGRRIDIASDEITGQEAAEALSRVTGRTIEYVEQPIDQVRAMSADYAAMAEWFNRVGYSADLAMLRREYSDIGWHFFESWARQQDWEMLLPARGPAGGKA